MNRKGRKTAGNRIAGKARGLIHSSLAVLPSQQTKPKMVHTVLVVRSLRSVLSIVGVLSLFLCSAAVTTAATTTTTAFVAAVDENNNHNSNPSASASTSSRSNQHLRTKNNDASRNLQTTAAPSQTFAPTTTFGPTETFSVSEIVYWN